jgi:flagellar motor switch protein FliM
MSKAAGIELPADLALGVVNRMAGGSGKRVPSARDLTRIEIGIARGFVGRLYEGLSIAWHRTQPVTFKPATQCRSAGEVGWNPGQALAIARMKCRVGAWDSEIAIALRSELLDQLPDDDVQRREKRSPATSERRNAEEARNMLGHVPVDMAADLGHARLTLRDVLGMQVGDVLRLDRSVGQAIPFKIGRRPGFQGRPGLSGNRLSVRIEGKTFHADAENAISPVGASQNPIEE